MKRDMTERMSGNRDHVKRALRRIEIDAIAIGNAMGCQFDPGIVCRVNPRGCQLAQACGTTDVVGMVMGEQDRAQLQMLTLQFVENRLRFARVDHECIAEVIVEHPDIVVGKRRQRLEVQMCHGPNYNGLRMLISRSGRMSGVDFRPGQRTRGARFVQVSTGDVFDLAEIESLLALEWAWVKAAPVVAPAGPALSIFPARSHLKSMVSAHHSITQLHLSRDGLAGDMNCSMNALPLETDSVQLIVVRHIFDVLGRHDELESELMRVLAPGGVLFLFGFNPASTWRLWWLRQAQHGICMPRWSSLGESRQRLASIDHVQSQHGYLGGSWPSISASDLAGDGKRWHGAWSLIARKQRIAARPADLHVRRQRVVLTPGMARMSSRRGGL